MNIYAFDDPRGLSYSKNYELHASQKKSYKSSSFQTHISCKHGKNLLPATTLGPIRANIRQNQTKCFSLAEHLLQFSISCS